MDTPRNVYKIDQDNPGSDLAAEAAAGLAAASIALRPTDPSYADTLLSTAIQLFNFADQYRGVYSDSIPVVKPLETMKLLGMFSMSVGEVNGAKPVSEICCVE